MKVISNYHRRPLITYEEASEKLRKGEDEPENENALYFRYRGDLYCLDDFLLISPYGEKAFKPPSIAYTISTNLKTQESYLYGTLSITYFSGIIIAYFPISREVIVGRYFQDSPYYIETIPEATKSVNE